MSNFIKIAMLGSFCVSALYAEVDLEKDWLCSNISYKQFKSIENDLISLGISVEDINKHPNVPGEFYIALCKKDKKQAEEILATFLAGIPEKAKKLESEVNAELKVRGIVLGTEMAAFFVAFSGLYSMFFPESINKFDVAKDTIKLLILGYFSLNNPLIKRAFFEHKNEWLGMFFKSDCCFMKFLIENNL